MALMTLPRTVGARALSAICPCESSKCLERGISWAVEAEVRLGRTPGEGLELIFFACISPSLTIALLADTAPLAG
jgi:hypothetical protein